MFDHQIKQLIIIDLAVPKSQILIGTASRREHIMGCQPCPRQNIGQLLAVQSVFEDVAPGRVDVMLREELLGLLT